MDDGRHATTVAEASLASALAAQVRSVAEGRDLSLDIGLRGRPQPVALEAREALQETIDAVLSSIEDAEVAHHLALEIAYLDDSMQVRVEHDAALEPGARARVEDGVLENFERIGGLGGSLSLSAGRGFGIRVEITLPYMGAERSPRTSEDERNPIRPRPANFDNPQFPLVEKLTVQEATCLSLLATGLSNKEIAARMHLSVGTVKFHLAQIYQKLGVQGRGRGAAVARARELGLIFD